MLRCWALEKSFLCSAYDNSSLINRWSFLRYARVAQRAERIEGSSRNTKRRSERRSWIPKGCISWRVRRRKSDSPTLSPLFSLEKSLAVSLKLFPGTCLKSALTEEGCIPVSASFLPLSPVCSEKKRFPDMPHLHVTSALGWLQVFVPARRFVRATSLSQTRD